MNKYTLSYSVQRNNIILFKLINSPQQTAQEAGMQHREYIDRKKENVIFKHM